MLSPPLSSPVDIGVGTSSLLLRSFFFETFSFVVVVGGDDDIWNNVSLSLKHI
jgi:hypothetical protein